jgi:hypothetical protein
VTRFAEKWLYDINAILPMGYDFRLCPVKLEERDHFFSSFKVSAL